MSEVSEPTTPGAVVRVHTSRSKYPEVWIASNINIGRWYPDSESWLTSSARHDHPQGARWEDLCSRGRVEVLTAGCREMFEHGWRAAARACAQAAEEVEYDSPAGVCSPGETEAAQAVEALVTGAPAPETASDPGTTPDGAHARVSRYTVCALPETADPRQRHHFEVHVEDRGTGWAVTQQRWCLGVDGEWDFEPLPSECDDEWLARHRFDLDTALRLAREAASEVLAEVGR